MLIMFSVAVATTGLANLLSNLTITYYNSKQGVHAAPWLQVTNPYILRGLVDIILVDPVLTYYDLLDFT